MELLFLLILNKNLKRYFFNQRSLKIIFIIKRIFKNHRLAKHLN